MTFAGVANGGSGQPHGNADFGVHQVDVHGHPGEPGSDAASQRQHVVTGRNGARKQLRITELCDRAFLVVPPSAEAVSVARRRLPSSHARPVTASLPAADADRRPTGWIHAIQPVCTGNNNNCRITILRHLKKDF